MNKSSSCLSRRSVIMARTQMLCLYLGGTALLMTAPNVLFASATSEDPNLAPSKMHAAGWKPLSTDPKTGKNVTIKVTEKVALSKMPIKGVTAVQLKAIAVPMPHQPLTADMMKTDRSGRILISTAAENGNSASNAFYVWLPTDILNGPNDFSGSNNNQHHDGNGYHNSAGPQSSSGHFNNNGRNAATHYNNDHHSGAASPFQGGPPNHSGPIRPFQGAPHGQQQQQHFQGNGPQHYHQGGGQRHGFNGANANNHQHQEQQSGFVPPDANRHRPNYLPDQGHDVQPGGVRIFSGFRPSVNNNHNSPLPVPHQQPNTFNSIQQIKQHGPEQPAFYSGGSHTQQAPQAQHDVKLSNNNNNFQQTLSMPAQAPGNNNYPQQQDYASSPPSPTGPPVSAGPQLYNNNNQPPAQRSQQGPSGSYGRPDLEDDDDDFPDVGYGAAPKPPSSSGHLPPPSQQQSPSSYSRPLPGGAPIATPMAYGGPARRPTSQQSPLPQPPPQYNNQPPPPEFGHSNPQLHQEHRPTVTPSSINQNYRHEVGSIHQHAQSHSNHRDSHQQQPTYPPKRHSSSYGQPQLSSGVDHQKTPASDATIGPQSFGPSLPHHYKSNENISPPSSGPPHKPVGTVSARPQGYGAPAKRPQYSKQIPLEPPRPARPSSGGYGRPDLGDDDDDSPIHQTKPLSPVTKPSSQEYFPGTASPAIRTPSADEEAGVGLIDKRSARSSCATKRSHSFPVQPSTIRDLGAMLHASFLFDEFGLTDNDVIDASGRDGSFTFFLPADEAKLFTSTDLLNSFKENRQELLKTLQNHIIPGKIGLDQLSKGASFISRASQSAILNAQRHPDQIFTVNGQRILQGDLAIPGDSQMLIHIISGFLHPIAEKDLMPLVQQCNKYDGFVTLATGTGFSSELNGNPEGYTLFLPSNDALSKVPKEELELIRTNSTALKEFLRYHAAEGIHYSHDLRDGQYLTSLHNKMPLRVSVNVDGCRRRLYEVNNSPLYRADIPAANGVVHVIDWVLLPSDHKWCDNVILP